MAGKLPSTAKMALGTEDGSSAVTDPSDWSIEALQDLDRFLRCPICFEYFKTPMILPCSHSYCSLCVRRYLRVKGYCPSCHKPVSDSQLLRNLNLEEIIKSFCQNRPILMKMSTAYSSKGSSKPTISTTTEEQNQPGSTSGEQKTITPPNKRRQKKRGQRLFSSDTKQPNHVEEEVVVVIHNSQHEPTVENYLKSDKIKTVEEVDMNETKDNDSCLVPSPPSQLTLSDDEISYSPPLLTPHPPSQPPNLQGSQDTSSDIQLAQNKFRESGSESGSPPTPAVTPIKFSVPPMKIENSRTQINATQSSAGPSTNYFDIPRVECPVCGLHVKEDYINVHLDLCLGRTPARSAGSPAHRLPRLPKLCFNIMKDRELKRRLKEYHLSPTGSRQVMISRLKEFTLQYNAQYDSSNPKTIAQIAAEVEETERLLNRPVKRSSVTMRINRSSTEEDITQEQQLYVEANKDQFSKLLDEMQTTSKGRSSSTDLPIVKSEPPDFDFMETPAPDTSSVKVEKSSPPLPHPSAVTTPTSQVTPSRNSSNQRQDKTSKRRREPDGDKSDPEYCPENSPSKRRTRK